MARWLRCLVAVCLFRVAKAGHRASARLAHLAYRMYGR